jgi:molybdopterin/thiamine biosynthesis adenylyltransferase
LDKAEKIDISLDAPDGRFSRFELISWWDQPRLRRARVLVIGAGALGNEIVKNCALLGIGHILVADMDRIEHSNLSRSVLFRESDAGRFKADVACQSARAIYPDIAAHPFIGNIVHDLGWGAYFWADVILGGLDNREARVAINQAAAFAGKPWIDGAIEVLQGVARVFDPASGACYECTMSAVDWKILESRRSCALLTRDEMQEGKVPTTPTTASIIAGIQVQEAVKQLHGLPTMAGQGLVFDGLSVEPYRVQYPRKADCMGHDRHQRLVSLGCGVADLTVGDLVARARKDLGPDAVVGLSRDIIVRLVCPSCGRSDERFARLGQVKESEAACSSCGQRRVPETLLTLGLDETLDRRTVGEIGVPRFDVVTARRGEESVSYLFDGDAVAVLGALAS